MIIEWEGKQIDTDKPMECCDGSGPAYFVGVRQGGKYVIEYMQKDGLTYASFDDDDALHNFRNIPKKKVVERWMVLNSDGGASYRETDYSAKQLADEWQAMGRKTSIHHVREEF